MYERFTHRARKVMQLANDEAMRCNHEYIGTEHLLLGLVKEGAGVAAHVLKNLGIDLRTIRREVEKIVLSGPDMVTMGKLPQTPRVKKVIEYALEEAKSLKHNYVGTEHLLLGLVREEEGVGAQVLMNLGLKLSNIRNEVLRLLGHDVAVEKSCHAPSQDKVPALTDCERKLYALSERLIAFISKEMKTDQTEERKRIASLERQLWNVRVLLGALVGTLAGALLAAEMGAVVGLLVGGGVAALGWRIPGALAGGGAGAVLGSAYLSSNGGGFPGALLGALMGFLIAEIGGTPKSQWILFPWRKR